MKKIAALMAASAVLLAASPPVAEAQIVGSLPYTLTNGTLADANQVMSNFNYIANQVNANVATAISSYVSSTVPALIASAVLTALPVGTVADWSGSVASIPSPWQLCNGTNGTPNLQDKFLIGAGSSYAVGATGGQTSVTPTITVGGTALTQANLPSYSLPVTDPGHSHGVSDPGHTHTIAGLSGAVAVIVGTFGYTTGGSLAAAVASQTPSIDSAATGLTVNTATTGITVASGGSGTTHTHTGSSSAVSTLPPYYALAKICKTS